MLNVYFTQTNLKRVLNYKRAKFLKPLLPKPYTFVTSSPWPIIMSLTLLNLILSGESTLHNCNKGIYSCTLTFLKILWFWSKWNGNVVRDSRYIKEHTHALSVGLRIGFLLFIVSEALVFLMLLGNFYHLNFATDLSWSFFYKRFTIFWGYINAPAMGIKWSLFLGISLDGIGITKVKWNPIFYLPNKK